MTTEATVVFVTVVALRFLVPLLIPKFPLPAILACLVIDGIDQTIFQTFGFDPPGYQNYDKAMDVYYLAIAFLSSMQNWTHSGAVRISRFLFFYRMIGVMAFELTGTLIITAVLVGLAILWFVVRPRLLAPDWAWRVAADPLPEEIDTAAKRDAWVAANVTVWSWWTLEKVVLIGLLSTIYARILPGLETSDLRMFVGIGAYVVVNSAISLLVARRVGSREGLAAAFFARSLTNVGLVLVARLILGGNALDVGATLFFVLLLSLLVTMHDRFAPVGAVRAEHHRADPEPAPAVRA